MKRKPVISFQERISWVKHEAKFQMEIAKIEKRAKKLDELLQKNKEEIKNG